MNTHGFSRKPEGTIERRVYNTWKRIRVRCTNKKIACYKNYGGRGIKVCKKWNKYIAFRKDMLSTYFIGASIERIDPNGNYCPKNCKWIYKKYQSANTRNTVWHEIDGERMCEAHMARKYGIHRVTLRRRLKRGLTLREALTLPKVTQKIGTYENLKKILHTK